MPNEYRQQNWIQNENGGTVKIYNARPASDEPEQSKDEIWKFRLEPRVASRVQSLIDAKRTNRSDFARDCIELGEVFHGFKDILLDNADFVVELCKRISKKF